MEIFNLQEEYVDLINSYFCYLVFMYSEICEEFRQSNKDITDPKNHLGDYYDLNKLVDHFENSIKLSKNTKFIKIIQKRALTMDSWNFLINQLKLKHLKQTDNYLDQLQFDDDF